MRYGSLLSAVVMGLNVPDDHSYPVSENDATRLSPNTRTETYIAGPGGRKDLETDDLEMKMDDLEHH